MLTVTVQWLSPTYEAALDDGPEWPPHPARLFCALVAAAEPGSADDEALRWLEGQGPPAVLAPLASASTMEAFVPTGGRSSVTKSNRVARTSMARTWRRSHLAADRVHFAWVASSPDGEILMGLRRLARRVPFVGRATSQAVVTVASRPPTGTEALERLEPLPAGPLLLRVPSEGYLERLRAAFEDGEPARSVATRRVFYGSARDVPAQETATSPGAYPTLVTVPFARDTALDGRLVVRVATAFKRAVLQRLGEEFDEEALALVHGHHDGTRRQCAFLGLPFVGRPHATGQLLGVGIALSPDLDQDVRRALLVAAGLDLDRPGLRSFHVPGMRHDVGLAADAEDVAVSRSGRWTTRPERWTRAARTWDTAYPIVLDRYPDRLEEAPAYVAQGCTLAGYPAPEDVRVRPVPAVEGAPWLRRGDLRRRRGDPPRPAVHARIRFPTDVVGPVAVGHLRHVGLGLCVPVMARRDEE